MKKLVRFSLIAVVVLLGGTRNAQANFDAIIPSEFEIRTTGNIGVGLAGWWGWIVATSDTLSPTDLQDATFTATITGQVSVPEWSQVFYNPNLFGPLSPGEVAGTRALGNSAYDQLLDSGESLKNPGFSFWPIWFTFPLNYEGTETLNASVTIGSDIVSYSTQVNFGDFAETYVVSGQRLSSTYIPAPGAIALASIGVGLVSWLRRRRAL